MNDRSTLVALALLVAGALGGCQQPELYEHTEVIDGTDYSLTIYGHSRKQSERAIEAVFAEMRLLAGFTNPEHGKPLARTNVMLKSGEWFSVNPSVTQILKQSIRYHELTAGLFNPAVLGALKEKYGLYANTKPTTTTGSRELQNFLASAPTMKDVNFDGIRLQGTHPGIRIDFDYLAYGYAIDIEIEHLRELGIDDAVVRIGDVQRVLGPKAKLKHPLRFSIPKQPASGTGTVDGSSYCQRTVGPGARTVFHPGTGEAVSRVRSVQIVANTASDASVACWVLMASAPEQWRQTAARIGIIAAVVESDDGQYHLWSRGAPQS